MDILSRGEQPKQELRQRFADQKPGVYDNAIGVLRKLGLINAKNGNDKNNSVFLSEMGMFFLKHQTIMSMEELVEFFLISGADKSRVDDNRPQMTVIVDSIKRIIEGGVVSLRSRQNAQKLRARSTNTARSFALTMYMAAIDTRFEAGDINSDEWFRWPDTDAPGGDGSVAGTEFMPEGMLSRMGYRVGTTNGVSVSERRQVLRDVFERPLPPVFPHKYMEKWGPKASALRLRTLAWTIAYLTKNLKRKHDSRMDVAISEYEQDIAFLHETYYVRKFYFDWPLT